VVCFSAEADLVAGIVVSGVGVDALRHVKQRRYLLLAILPLLLGLHQVVEAFVWWGLEGRVPARVGAAATWLYLLIAFAVLPPLVPAAVLSVEADERRRRRLGPLVVLGGAVAVVLLLELGRGPVQAEVACRYLEYHTGLGYGGYVLPFYVAAVCGPLLLSGTRRFVVFGVANLAAVTVLAWLLATGVISLWCVWAAVTSVAIVREVRAKEQRESWTAAVAPT
jgi:hypothetical protein